MALRRSIRTYGGIRDEKSTGKTDETWPALLDDKVEEEQIERVGEREEETHTDRGDLPNTFEELGLSEDTLTSIKELGFEEPTLIQAATIPALLGGDDVMGQAKTGTGKTAAFGLPAIEKCDASIPEVQAIVLCPTRELCQQVAKEFVKFAKHSGHKTLAIYGGQPMKVQLDGLQDCPQLVVGTPGRVIDHLRRGTLDLSHVRYLVLDEADEMLDMGFIDDIRFIVSTTPRQRQSALFSATFPVTIRRLARASMNDPRVIHTSGRRLTVESVTQIFYEVPRHRKFKALCSLLDHEEIDQAVVFCRTRWETDLLHRKLDERGYTVKAIHGDLPQSTRTRVMEEFRSGKLDLLVATDVAARGLDISGVSHVINYHLPQDPEVYVHRIGRTARMGTDGYAMSLVSPEEYHQLAVIQEKADSHMEQRELPNEEDQAKKRRMSLAKAVVEGVDPEVLGDYMEAAQSVLDAEIDTKAVIAFFLEKAYRRNFPDTGGKDEPSMFGDTGARPGHVRIHINVGTTCGEDVDTIKGKICEIGGFEAEKMVHCDVLERATFIEIPEDVADEALTKLDGCRIGSSAVSAAPARPRKKRDGGRDRDGRGGRDGGRGGRDGGRGRGGRDGRRGGRDGGRDRDRGRGRGRGRDRDDRPRGDGEGGGEGDEKPRRERRPRGEGGDRPRGEGGEGGDGERKRRRRRRRRGPRGEGGEGGAPRSEGGGGDSAPSGGGDGGGNGGE